jgi:hypothetical protein
MSKTKEIVIVVSVVSVVLLVICATITHLYCLNPKSRTADPEAGKAPMMQNGSDNAGFLQRHLASLRAWKKPENLNQSEAHDLPIRTAGNTTAGPSKPLGLDIDFDAPRPAELAKKLYKGKPMEHYTKNIYKKYRNAANGGNIKYTEKKETLRLPTPDAMGGNNPYYRGPEDIRQPRH